jgi:CBS domain-containing protein
MAMLSELLHFRVTDAHSEIATLADFAISQLGMETPPVTHLIYRKNREPEAALPWNSVHALDRKNRQIQVKSYSNEQSVDTLVRPVRLRRDVLDALIIDLRNHRVTRANDLWLDQEETELRLSAIDIGARAILRRMTRGRYRGVDRGSLYEWKYIEFLRGAPQAVKAGAGYNRRIVHLPPGEIAFLSASLPYLHAAELLELLPGQLAADTLEVMAPERQLQVFEELEEARALELLERMAPDLAADIVGRLETRLAQRLLNGLPKKYGTRIVELLRYPENSVGGIMANDMVTLPPELKVGRARELLRERLKEPDFVYFVYVVEERSPRRLRGVISLRQFLLADDDQAVEEIMNPYLIVLSPTDSPTEAAYKLLNSQLAALPVVGAEGELLGTVTIDAAVSQVAPRSWRTQAPRVFS